MFIKLSWDPVKEVKGEAAAVDVQSIAAKLQEAENVKDARRALNELAIAASRFAELSSGCVWIARGFAENKEQAGLLDMVLMLADLVRHMAGAIENARGKYEGGAVLLGWLVSIRDDLEDLLAIAKAMEQQEFERMTDI